MADAVVMAVLVGAPGGANRIGRVARSNVDGAGGGVAIRWVADAVGSCWVTDSVGLLGGTGCGGAGSARAGRGGGCPGPRGGSAGSDRAPAAAVTWKRSGVPWWGSPTVIVRPSRMSTVANRAPSTNMPLRL